MFKKLKDKIVEEAKNSPQRFQQITQSVSDKLQSSTVEENFFSIDDDVDSRPSLSGTPIKSNDGGFTSVSLHSSTPVAEPRQRRTSNTSMTSDVSFLPRYEPGNMYHLQSDIEASASEMEDNVSNSSTKMGHITKEQIYAELQRVRLRYHKYRGRYTDLANHYKDLERENGKMKVVLVETQDISIRRVGELREQCQLEQKAKAHLENALRVEIDEKQYIIDTLKTKIELLNTSNTSEIIFEADGVLTNGNSLSPEYTQLSADLANAKIEIDHLNERLQELKASKIISHTKEANLLSRINDLEAEITKTAQNNSKTDKMAELEANLTKMADLETKLSQMVDLESKIVKMKDFEDKQQQIITELTAEKAADRLKRQISEEERNIQLARDKLAVHTELQNKDLEINNLKSDLELLKEELDRYEKDAGNKTRMDNLQGQNTKLIDKVEVLTAKCNNMEAELLKMEHLRQENRKLIQTIADDLAAVHQLEDALHVSRNDVLLLSEEKTDLQQQLENIIKCNVNLNEKYTSLNKEHNNLDGEYNKLLIDNTSLSDSLIAKNTELEQIRADAKASLLTLEARITNKLQRKFDQRSERMAQEYDAKVGKLSVNDASVGDVRVKLLEREDRVKTLQGELAVVAGDLSVCKVKYSELEASYVELIEENRLNVVDKVDLQMGRDFIEKRVEDDQIVIQQLEEQVESMYLDVRSFKDQLDVAMVNNSTLQEIIQQMKQTLINKDEFISELTNKINKNAYKITSLQDKLITKDSELAKLTDEYNKNIKLNQLEIDDLKKTNKIELTNLQNKLAIDANYLTKQQSTKLAEHKLLLQHELNNIITAIKLNVDQVQAENSGYQTRVEELAGVSGEVEVRNGGLLEDNRRLTVEMDERSVEVVSLRAALVELTAEKVRLVKEVGDLNGVVGGLVADQERHKRQIVALQIAEEEMARNVEDKSKCLQEISNLKNNLQHLLNDRQHLEQQASQFHNSQRQHSAITSELSVEREKTSRLTDELSLLTVRTRQLAEDRDRLIEDTDRLVVELEQTRLMQEEQLKGRTDQTTQLDAQIALLTSAQAQITSLTAQLESSVANASATRLKSSADSVELQQKVAELSELTRRLDVIVEENRAVKEDLVEVGRLREAGEGERRRLELMVGDMDRSYSEMKHENQLLKDEIQELKIAPMNLNTSSKQAIVNGTNNNTAPEITDCKTEMDQLREKVQQYKIIDATNRTSIEFYELELDRARARGDKFERKLDETLVTLRHCAELSSVDTQVEYLRHVLYNYMLGREGVVLARVIAAVCKFDSVQTEAVLKHEQQKQTLLGQLGIL